MQKVNKNYINKVVKDALKEDLFPSGDITSNLLNKNLKISAKIVSNQKSILAQAIQKQMGLN